MTDYVALLRGIAPTNPLMKNVELATVFERIGMSHVRTVIASGNVLFASEVRSKRSLESTIEAALHDHLGAPCSTIVRSRRQIEATASLDTFDRFDDGPSNRCHVTFLKHRPRADQHPPDDEPAAQVVGVRDRAVFTVFDTTVSQTPRMMTALERAYGREITTRTWRTVHRIAAKFDS